MIFKLLEIIGSLGVFLYGMRVMSDGIQKVAGERLNSVLNFMTKNPFLAVFTGFSVTCLVQSSSATTVMVVSFVNAGLLSLVQSIGVIMGANIGTTLTGWIVSILGFKFNIATIALPCVGIGVPMTFSKNPMRKDLGEVLIGFGILFLGLNFLKGSVPDIKHNPEVLEFLSNYTSMGFLSLLLFVAVGTVLTFIVQSSSAAMAITITMAFKGWIDYPTAAAIVLGENIGTTITAYLAALRANVSARRAARAHMLFNLAGVIWMLALFSPFLKLVDIIVPGPSFDPKHIPTHMAMFHTLFNICNTTLFVGFIPQIARLVEKLVSPKEGEKSKEYHLKYISTGIQEMPEINLLNAKNEISKMSQVTLDMFGLFLDVFKSKEKNFDNKIKNLKDMENLTDQMQEEISQYLIHCSHEQLNKASLNNVSMMIRIADELESIGDSCYTLGVLAQRRRNKNLVIEEMRSKDVLEFSNTISTFMLFIQENLNNRISKDQLKRAYKLENEINHTRINLRKNSQDRLTGGAEVKSELLIQDIINHFEKIGDFSLNISQCLRELII